MMLLLMMLQQRKLLVGDDADSGTGSNGDVDVGAASGDIAVIPILILKPVLPVISPGSGF